MNTTEPKSKLHWLKCWFLCTPRDTDFFGVNIRKLIQAILVAGCEWEFRTRKGEEEPGSNIGVKYCKRCNRKQYAYWRSNIDWRDE